MSTIQYVQFQCNQCPKSFTDFTSKAGAWLCPVHKVADMQIINKPEERIKLKTEAKQPEVFVKPTINDTVKLPQQLPQELMSEQTEFQQEHKQKLQAIMDIIQPSGVAAKQGSKFITVKDGFKDTLVFDANRVEVVDSEYQGKLSKKVRFTVIQQDSEKWLELSKRWARQIIKMLLESDEDQVPIHIERTGVDAESTVYYISKANE